MKRLVVALVCVLAMSAVPSRAAEVPPVPQEAATRELTPEDKEILRELSDEMNDPILSWEGWILGHCASEAGGARAGKLFAPFGESMEAGLAAIGGAQGLREALRGMLTDEDPVVRGFAAAMLAVVKDQDSKEKIAALLRRPDTPPAEEWQEEYNHWDRSRAAMALGMLGAKEYTEEIVALLKDDDEYVREGAALGLGYMNAREHAKEVAELLDDEADEVRESACASLARMGARDLAPETARLFDEEEVSQTNAAACYALAKLDAREQAGKIAGLLDDEFDSGTAAKALALLGAEDYAGAIARVLTSENPLRRQDALLALGILQARQYEDAVAERLNDEEAYVCHAAAVALVLMDSQAHAREALAAAEGADRPPFSYHDFSPVVLEEVIKLRQRYEDNLEAMKARAGAGAAER
jgi:HEAT repeat protein